MPIKVNFNKCFPKTILRVQSRRGKKQYSYAVTAERFTQLSPYPVSGGSLKAKIIQAHSLMEFDGGAQITITEESHAPIH